MRKLLVLLALIILVACAPQAPPQPVAAQGLETQSQFVITQPPAAKVETVPETKTASPQTVNVDIAGFKYSPNSVKVKVGDTVTWTQKDAVMHTVTIVSGPETFDSGLLKKDQTFSYTFTKPGTYSYKCTPHPNMRGEVIVE